MGDLDDLDEGHARVRVTRQVVQGARRGPDRRFDLVGKRPVPETDLDKTRSRRSQCMVVVVPVPS